MAGEVFLLSRLGVVWTGAAAAGVNLVAATGALAYARSRPQVATLTGEADAPTARPVRITRRPARLLSATFLSGAVLLALEVVWFRLLLLLVGRTSRAFAVMRTPTATPGRSPSRPGRSASSATGCSGCRCMTAEA